MWYGREKAGEWGLMNGKIHMHSLAEVQKLRESIKRVCGY